MDAHALIGVQERQLLGLPGFSDIFPTPTKDHDHSSSASASSSSSSVSSSVSESSVTPSSSISSSSSVAPTTSSTPDAITSITSDSFSTTTSQSTQTVTAFAADGSNSPSTTASPTHTSFLQNKVLSGLVLSLAGIVGLVMIVSLLTFVVRRKRNRRLVEDAVSFDPVKLGGGGYNDSALEASHAPRSTYPRSSTSTGHLSNAPEVRQASAFADYAPPLPPSQLYKSSSASLTSYHSQQGYSNSQQQVQQAAWVQPFSWAPPPQQVDPYRGTRGSGEAV